MHAFCIYHIWKLLKENTKIKRRKSCGGKDLRDDNQQEKEPK